ncbi:ABC transporter substrate-binding protein [Brachybacterium alimentarium]|uniref:Glycine/betaine ABC transporter n=1 Tax=Brachybacterium alimentarium TaxID=47845 RepID=A0A2A3YJ77_9MICO|nr:ABC transporter substrate-binding protein [Brachybacterium alimentarium]PCC33590.1 glycine/betaine ABC transporter [Brachybacterium alimentarium]PCC39406.1 glycine/betaine ABC transporter [Brachybacterium alimentarium]RCS74573.1 glycine/betaine ABC transporter [Brachybacterium alimentarium]RCS75278.1 glycine/betaine ABC transporter [Brachybacterium alimentarium]RCS91563.1 glycine/betaine ABC transporter [Brachybacterium alimentarium]
MAIHSTRRHLLGAFGIGGVALGAAACSSEDPFAEGEGDGGSASDGGGSAADSGTIVVGSQAYYSNEIIAELFAQVLEKAGLTVDRQYQIGQREVYMPELEGGSLDVMPEYLGNLLQNYEADAESASPEEIHSALSDSLPEELRVLDFAEATDQDSYTTTSDFASENSLTTIADLAGIDDLKIAANSEFEVRPYGPEGAKKVYGVDISVVPVEDGGGSLTVQALTDGDVQLADLYTSDPAIAENDFVVLEDPESLILPQNVVPVVSAKLDDEAEKALNGVIAELSADDLVELNRRSVEDQASSADIAKGWLEEKGLA